MKIEPDWKRRGTSKFLEAEMGNGFRFKGPGLYLSNSDTVLIVSAEPEKSPWVASSRDDKEWILYCWDCPFQQTILSHIHIPLREGSRK